MKETLFKQAISIAEQYQWDTENAIPLLKQHIIPEGFCREVGNTIALFLRPLIIISLTKEEEYTNRSHARQLANLRFTLAKIRMLDR